MTASLASDRVFPYVNWRVVAEQSGVELHESGAGADTLLFVPGMTGGGQATLELCIRVAEKAAAAGKPFRLLLVDYTREQHPTFEELRDTVEALTKPALGDRGCTLWTESLGCLTVPPPRFDAAFNVKKRVMISAFGGVPAVPLRLGLIGMTISPPPLFRWVMGPMGRWAFGPPGDRPHHVFFQAVADTPPRVARRRSSWLSGGRRFDDWYQATTVPTKIWLGARDRLINFDRERALFAGIGAARPDFHLSVVEGGGHVVTDTKLLDQMFAEVYPWVVS